MNAPNLPSLTLSLPAPQTGHRRGSRPESSSGKKCRPSSASSAASTWLMVSSLVPSTAAEKSRQKRGDEPPAVLRQEAALLEPDVRTILQHLQDRRISRRAADAELFELLDEARLGVARRRLREMLPRFDRAACEPLALAHRRQSGRFAFLLGSIVAVLLVECQKPVKNDDRTGRP